MAANVSENYAAPHPTLFYQQMVGLNDLYLFFTELHYRHINEGASLFAVLGAGNRNFIWMSSFSIALIFASRSVAKRNRSEIRIHTQRTTWQRLL